MPDAGPRDGTAPASALRADVGKRVPAPRRGTSALLGLELEQLIPKLSRRLEVERRRGLAHLLLELRDQRLELRLAVRRAPFRDLPRVASFARIGDARN